MRVPGEVLPQYMYVLRAYFTVKTYVLRGVLERQTRWRHEASRIHNIDACVVAAPRSRGPIP